MLFTKTFYIKAWQRIRDKTAMSKIGMQKAVARFTERVSELKGDGDIYKYPQILLELENEVKNFKAVLIDLIDGVEVAAKCEPHSAILLPIKASLERAKYLESDTTTSTSLLGNQSKSSIFKNLTSQINLFSPPALTNQSTVIPETQINQYLLNYESIITEAKSCHDQHVSKVQKEVISVWVLKLSLLNDLKVDKSKLENKRLYYDSVRKKSKFSVKRNENDTEDKEIMKSFEDLELYEAKYIQKMKDQVTQESKSQVQIGMKQFLKLQNQNRLEINKILEKTFLEQSETSGSNPDDSGIQNTSLTNSQVSFSRDFEDTMPRSQNLNGTVLYSYQAGLDDVLSIQSGENITILDNSLQDGWSAAWQPRTQRHGYVPSSYVLIDETAE